MRLYQLAFLLFLFSCPNLFAQATQGTFVLEAIQKGEQVELTISSDKPFYVGGNVHVLHIGKSTYAHTRQSKGGAKYFMTFLIPHIDYLLFSESDAVWMTYGNPATGEKMDIKALAKEFPGIFWDLGNFSNEWFIR